MQRPFMRKLALTTGIAGLLILATPMAAAGGTPTRSPIPDIDNTFDFPAGMACSFELAGQPVANNQTLTTFPPDANGDVVQIITGSLKEQLTNVATGKSIVANLSGLQGRFVTHPDGSITASFAGGAIFVVDLPAPAAFIVTGHVVVNFTASGQVIFVSQTGTKTDLCAALS